jgi:small subunit ribosomal protein SAe
MNKVLNLKFFPLTKIPPINKNNYNWSDFRFYYHQSFSNLIFAAIRKKMSLVQGKQSVLKPTDYDIQMMLACGVHLGTKNLDKSQVKYTYKRRKIDGIHIINLGKTWEKLMLAARVIAAIENPADVCAISASNLGQRAVLKFSTYTGAHQIAGRFIPGTFTNQIQDKFLEPRLLIVTDAVGDFQPIKEASYVNIPVIAFCNTDSHTKFVDIAIPCNNKSKNSVAIMYWLLTREVLRLKRKISRKVAWDVKPDLYLFRDVEEQEKNEKVKSEKKDNSTTVVASNLETETEEVEEDDGESENSMFKSNTVSIN